jgi:hypothetical protein
MRRPRLSRLAQRLRYALRQTPALTPLPVCPRCGMQTPAAEWSTREVSCKACEHDADPCHWDDENDRPFLPEEE